MPVNRELASLERATEWLNSPPLTAAALRGKVVLVDFWTYTCINWLRTLPYVRAWAEKYRKQGLVVIGVHSPEFSFEKDLNNVRRAVKDMRIDYPGRGRQRPCHLARVQEPILAGAVFRRCARGAFGIINSARAPTNSRKWSSRNCWPRPARATSVASRSRSTAAASKRPPIGAA